MKSLGVGACPSMGQTHATPLDMVVLDDHPMDRACAVQFLSTLRDLRIVGFEGPQSMLSALGESLAGFKHLLLDLQMPEMDGFQVILQLAENGFAGKLIVVSSHEVQILDAAVQMARSLGLANSVALRKPYVPKQLWALIASSQQAHVDAQGSRVAHFLLDVVQAIVEGQFSVHYQPKVSCRTGLCVGLEALPRRLHPEFGVVQPSDFIVAAEASDQMDRLTRHVMTVAFSQAKHLLSQGRQLSVNVSMGNLTDIHFPDWVKHQLAVLAIQPYQLCLEVTETKLMRNPFLNFEVLGRLRLLGVDNSIDDFGTDQSSLKQLLDVPFQELKVDRAFVTGVHKDMAKQAILVSSIAVAVQLGIGTVVEGVEEEGEFDCVRHLGADMVQGYLLSRPLDPDRMDDWLRSWTSWPGWLADQPARMPWGQVPHDAPGVVC